jgi:hypothetical protein
MEGRTAEEQVPGLLSLQGSSRVGVALQRFLLSDSSDSQPVGVTSFHWVTSLGE